MDEQALQEFNNLKNQGVKANPYRVGRSMAMSTNGIVASSHLLASQAGIDMLKSGGTAMDAAVAAAAVLAVVEPMMTGLGGDAFFLYYDSSTKKVHGLNGSGRSPCGLSREYFSQKQEPGIKPLSWEAVTVPGAVDAWEAGLNRFGSKDFNEVLAPAVMYAEQGFPVTETVARVWKLFEHILMDDPWAEKIYLKDGQAPEPGSVFKNPYLAESLKIVAQNGRDGFYNGRIAAEIARYAKESNGFLTTDDFKSHSSEWVEPIQTNYHGYDVLQIPPNGQGIGVLMMLNILEGFDLKQLKHNSPEYLHLMIEAKKLAYADMHNWVGDADKNKLPPGDLLSKDYAAERRSLIDADLASPDVSPGNFKGGDTVYLTAVDKYGNAASFINSIFTAFGSAVVGGETGLLMQNRGYGFSFENGHVNEYAPGKRPFHTIIPGMVLKNGDLYLSYGVMGGTMQPQGHVQFLVNHIDFGLTIQEAIDVPRFNHLADLQVRIEHGIPIKTMESLEAYGHDVIPGEGLLFGGAQAVQVDPETGTYFGASDPRKDGAALAY